MICKNYWHYKLVFFCKILDTFSPLADCCLMLVFLWFVDPRFSLQWGPVYQTAAQGPNPRGPYSRTLPKSRPRPPTPWLDRKSCPSHRKWRWGRRGQGRRMTLMRTGVRCVRMEESCSAVINVPRCTTWPATSPRCTSHLGNTHTHTLKLEILGKKCLISVCLPLLLSSRHPSLIIIIIAFI